MTKTTSNKNYVITSAQAKAHINHKFMDSLENYCKQNDSELIVLPMIGNAARQDYLLENFHNRVRGLSPLYEPKSLNNNIGIEQFNIRPYQIDPITGLNRFAQREKSLIFASPKQRWKYISHSNSKIPKALISTGACTMPNYAIGWDVSAERRRLGNISKRDHEYGAIVVEIVNGNKFHWRNINAQTNGKFTDLNKLYSGNKVSDVKPKAMVCGDWHTGYTNNRIKKATLEMIALYQPEKIFLHDFFDGHSISHHSEKALISEKIREGADKGNLSLEDELILAGQHLNDIQKYSGNAQIYVIASNHLEFLHRYLDEGRFIKDPHNLKMALKLASAYADHLDPVEEGIRMMGDIGDNVTFLKRTDDFKVNGYQLSSHGDKGAGGGRGSLTSKENDFGKSISGHCHTSEKLRQTYTVGCMLPFDMHYLKGSPISWTHSHSFVYPTGVQMINIIDGQHRRK